MRIVLMFSLFLVVAGGCQTPVAPPRSINAYNLTVHLDPSLHDSSGVYPGVDVYIKGVSEFEKTQDWDHRANVDEYMHYRGTIDNSGAERVLRLGANEATTRTLMIDSEAWRLWDTRRATTLVVIANYPRTRPSDAARDRRVLILPLARERYPDSNLRIDVTADGLDLETPPK